MASGHRRHNGDVASSRRAGDIGAGHDAHRTPRDSPPADLRDRALADPGRWLREGRPNLAAVLALARHATGRSWPAGAAAALAGGGGSGRADPPLPTTN
ncbi:hypothetical protein [Micromonospora sp. DT31]|uniref:hypothetical protein n=1 Tax=Micromonospora sp. DT31 TaxID=3393434 RepID=UPI003CEA86B2